MGQMDKDKALEEIFNSDSLGILKVVPKSSPRTADDRLVSSFMEIIDFYEKNNMQEPKSNPDNVQEFQIYSRLKSFRDNADKKSALAQFDKYNLLKSEKKDLKTFDDIFSDDDFDLLDNNSEGLYDFKHIPNERERADADFVARRKPCKDFVKYEALFKAVQKDLSCNKRKLIPFNEKQLEEGNFFVHNGILLLLDKTIDLKQDKTGKIDGRTRVIFENGTESSMKFRSLGKNLFDNGKAVTESSDKSNNNFSENFSSVTEEDEASGYIYVLKSKTNDERISSIKNLYKIGFSTTEVADRIKNAEKEPTYLMAPVEFIAGWKCYNMNPQKFEQLIHNFFGNSCLDIDVFDENGKRHSPREWFVAPLDVIKHAIELIISGKILNYRYDPTNEIISEKI